MPDLTVCVTTYDRWESCGRALRSVCSTGSVDSQVILVDDSSPTPAPGDLREFMEQNDVLYLRHDVNRGLAAARNTAIEAAEGEYFSFCDDDDRWPEGFGDDLLEAVRAEGRDAAACIGLSTARRECCPDLGTCVGLRDLMRRGVTPPVSSQLYRTELLHRVGGYTTGVRSGVDHDLWVSLAEIDPVVVLRWGAHADTTVALVADRMTTDETSRRRGIREALRIWEPRIVRAFGREFYEHFRRSYEGYLNYRFFRREIARGAYLTAARKAVGRGVVAEVARRLSDRIRGRCRCGTFPAYER